MVCFLETSRDKNSKKSGKCFFQGSTLAKPFVVWNYFSLSCRASGAYIASVFARSFVENVEVFESERTTNGTSLLV